MGPERQCFKSRLTLGLGEASGTPRKRAAAAQECPPLTLSPITLPSTGSGGPHGPGGQRGRQGCHGPGRPVLTPLPRPQVPMARASILWLIGEYCEHVPKIAPDVLRKMAKSFTAEEDIVKLQVINLAAKLYLTNSKQVKTEPRLSDVWAPAPAQAVPRGPPRGL